MPVTETGRSFPRSHVVLEFEIPEVIAPSLRHIRDIWQRLKLMRTDMPLTDDFDLDLLREHANRLLVINVVEQPLWLRVESAGYWIIEAYGEPLAGRYVENIDPRLPLDDLWVQCMAAIKDRQPVLYRHAKMSSYERIALPLWGDSRVEKLIVGISDVPLLPGEAPNAQSA